MKSLPVCPLRSPLRSPPVTPLVIRLVIPNEIPTDLPNEIPSTAPTATPTSPTVVHINRDEPTPDINRRLAKAWNNAGTNVLFGFLGFGTVIISGVCRSIIHLVGTFEHDHRCVLDDSTQKCSLDWSQNLALCESSAAISNQCMSTFVPADSIWSMIHQQRLLSHQILIILLFVGILFIYLSLKMKIKMKMQYLNLNLKMQMLILICPMELLILMNLWYGVCVLLLVHQY